MKVSRVVFVVIALVCCDLVNCNSRRSEGNRQTNTGSKDSDAPFWAARGKRERNGELSGVIKYELVRPPAVLGLESGPGFGFNGGDAEDSSEDLDASNWPKIPIEQQTTQQQQQQQQQLQQHQVQLNAVLENAVEQMHPWSYKMKRTSFLPGYPSEEVMGHGTGNPTPYSVWLTKASKEHPNPTSHVFNPNSSSSNKVNRRLTMAEYFAALLGMAAADREKKNGDKDAKNGSGGGGGGGDIPFWAARG